VFTQGKSYFKNKKFTNISHFATYFLNILSLMLKIESDSNIVNKYFRPCTNRTI